MPPGLLSSAIPATRGLSRRRAYARVAVALAPRWLSVALARHGGTCPSTAAVRLLCAAWSDVELAEVLN